MKAQGAAVLSQHLIIRGRIKRLTHSQLDIRFVRVDSAFGGVTTIGRDDERRGMASKTGGFEQYAATFRENAVT
jgi:hypothetical protein